MDKNEQKALAFLDSYKLKAERFSKKEKRLSKTPDFRIYKGNELQFFCEVKTKEEDRWLDEQFEKNPGAVVVGGSRPDPTYNNVSTRIHEAIQQFDAVNPDVKLPNVLVIVNEDTDGDERDLIAVLTGNIYTGEYDKAHPIFRKFSHGRIKDKKRRVHLYVWIEKKRSPFFLFNQEDDRFFELLCGLFGKDSRSIKNIY